MVVNIITTPGSLCLKKTLHSVIQECLVLILFSVEIFVSIVFTYQRDISFSDINIIYYVVIKPNGLVPHIFVLFTTIFLKFTKFSVKNCNLSVNYEGENVLPPNTVFL